MGPSDPDPLPFLHGPVPAAFRRWEVVLPAGGTRRYVSAEWQDALVVVEGGDLELVCRQGRVTPLRDGAIGFLADLPLALLRNRGEHPVRLLAVARSIPGRPADEFGGAPRSLPPNDPDPPRDQEHVP